MSIMGWITVGIFSMIWLWGWISAILYSSVGQMSFGFKKFSLIVLLFFVWWYVALMMVGDR